MTSANDQGEGPRARALSELSAADSELQDTFDRVIDAAEALMATGEALDQTTGEAIATVAGTLLEAAAMRDIIGQRLTAIRESVEHLEAGIASELETNRDKTRKIEEKKGDGSASESGLLNGPQLPGAAKSQAEVDALFDKLD